MEVGGWVGGLAVYGGLAARGGGGVGGGGRVESQVRATLLTASLNM